MSSFESEQRENLLGALKQLGLDEKWAIAVAALCAQEIAIRKRLESLGETPSDEDFQVVAARLEEKLKNQGETPPEILLSIARAYTHLRAKMVHHGHSVQLSQEEVNSLVTNTTALLNRLYKNESTGGISARLGEELVALDMGTAIVRIGKLTSKQKREAVLSLMAKYSQIESIPIRDTSLVSLAEKCRVLMDAILTGLEESDAANALDESIRGFSLVVPDRVMGMVSVLRSKQRVREMLVKMGHLDWVVSSFANSWSFETASSNSDVILAMEPLLSKTQIETVLNALASNDQIRYSWGAQRKMEPFIEWAVGRADLEIVENARINFLPRDQ